MVDLHELMKMAGLQQGPLQKGVERSQDKRVGFLKRTMTQKDRPNYC